MIKWQWMTSKVKTWSRVAQIVIVSVNVILNLSLKKGIKPFVFTFSEGCNWKNWKEPKGVKWEALQDHPTKEVTNKQFGFSVFNSIKSSRKDLNFGKMCHSSSSILHLESKNCFNQKFSAIWTVSSRTFHSLFLSYSVEF